MEFFSRSPLEFTLPCMSSTHIQRNGIFQFTCLLAAPKIVLCPGYYEERFALAPMLGSAGDPSTWIYLGLLGQPACGR